MVYECVSCGTSFKHEDGTYDDGWLCCPHCGGDDLVVIWSEAVPEGVK